MGSNDAVSLYQADFEKCCVGSSSSVDPVIVASNLLLDNRNSRRLRIVSTIEFKPWYDCTKLVPLSFKFQPPKLPVWSSVQKSNPPCDNKSQTLPSEAACLLEFSPVYSGKSCLKFELKRYTCSQHGSDEGVHVQSPSNLQVLSIEDCGLPIQYNHQPTLTSTGEDSSGKNRLLQEELDPLAKSHWYASPYYVSGKSRKQNNFVLDKFKEINLQQVKDKYRLNDHQRGKWIMRIASLKGKNLTLEQLWKKVRSLIKESHLPHCNGKFQKTQGEVWVYCDFKHSLKVRSTLEKALGNVGPFLFCVHPVGSVMEL